tara:strand:+ start:257 stop:694 length:438 start_codon:yes stop_codon:yes gene_type:complete
MKRFKSYINESMAVDAGYGGQVVGDNLNFANLSDDNVVEALNAFVGSLNGEYLNPRNAIMKLREKLSRVGLDFQIPSLDEDSGEVSTPLIVFGGKFGKTGEESPDEITNDPTGQMGMRENPLQVHFTYDKASGSGSTLLTARVGE